MGCNIAVGARGISRAFAARLPDAGVFVGVGATFLPLRRRPPFSHVCLPAALDCAINQVRALREPARAQLTRQKRASQTVPPPQAEARAPQVTAYVPSRVGGWLGGTHFASAIFFCAFGISFSSRRPHSRSHCVACGAAAVRADGGRTGGEEQVGRTGSTREVAAAARGRSYSATRREHTA